MPTLSRLARRFPIAAAILLLGAARSLTAQTVAGRLLQEGTDRPVAGASVTLLTAEGAAVGTPVQSGEGGDFTLQAPGQGVFRLRAERAGFRTAISPAMELRTGESIGITLRRLPDTLALRPVVVTAAPRRPSDGRVGGFYDRAGRHGFGTFITREQIDRARPFRVTELLQGIAGLRVQPFGRGSGATVRTTEGCVPMVYLDGLRFPLLGESVDDLVAPMMLEGVEVYPRSIEVPAEFQTLGMRCGAILLWTRREE